MLKDLELAPEERKITSVAVTSKDYSLSNNPKNILHGKVLKCTYLTILIDI